MMRISAKTVFFAVCLAFFAVAAARFVWLKYGPPAGEPRFECDEPIVDVGVVEKGKRSLHKFVVRNSGGKPLTIKAEPGCASCLAVKDSMTVPPHSEAALPVSVHTDRLLEGSKVFRVLLELNDQRHRYVVLQIKAKVVPNQSSAKARS